MMDKEHLAQEAERLSKDPVFLEVLARIRSTAVEALIKTDADEKTAILALQAKAAICDAFPDELKAMILSKEEKRRITAV